MLWGSQPDTALDDYEMLFLVYGKERIETDRERKKERKRGIKN